MSRHVIKYEYKGGQKLPIPEVWCGAKIKMADEWMFMNAHHAALAAGGSVAPCKKCIKAIIAQLEKEL